MTFPDKIVNGDIRSIAKGISIVESGGIKSDDLLNKLYNRNCSYIIGVTGPPGAGKSSLINLLIDEFKHHFRKIAILAVDPSSPFTGGALLGDRIRMQQHAMSESVFIRSMASRGHLGGISGATKDAIKIVSAAGYDLVIIETVGVGQSEIDIVKLSDTTILILVPGYGDEIQVMKSGIMEIGEVFVVNKSDKSGSEKLATTVKWLLKENYGNKSYLPPVILSSVTNNTGIKDIVKAVLNHKNYIEKNGIDRDKIKKRIKDDINILLKRKINEFIQHHLKYPENIEKWVNLVISKKSTPYEIIREIKDNMILDVKEDI